MYIWLLLKFSETLYCILLLLRNIDEYWSKKKKYLNNVEIRNDLGHNGYAN